MCVFINSMILAITITLALIVKGTIERGLWIISAVMISGFYNKNKGKKIVKKIFSHGKGIVGGAILGYIVVLLLLSYLQYPLEEAYIGENYVDNNKTAVIMVFKGEPNTYKLSLAIRNHTLENQLWQNIFLPFQLFREKLYYERVGNSKINNFSARLRQQMNHEIGEKYSLYEGYLFNTPYLSETIYTAIMEGNKEIILCPIFLTDHNEAMLMEDMVKEMHLHEYGIKIEKTQTLWNSDSIARSFSRQINDFKASRYKQKVGIILIGEEREKSKNSATFLKQDLLFRDKVKDYLIRNGYSDNKIKLCYFEEDSIRSEIENLMEYGVREILLVLSSENLLLNHFQLQLEEIIKKIDSPYAVNISSLDPWSFNEEIKKELVNRIKLLDL